MEDLKMMAQPISKSQLRRLQTLYGQLAAHAIEGNSRESRLSWASDQVGRRIESFSALTGDEARRLIDGLQGQLGVKAPSTKRLDRDSAHRAGTDGRHESPYKDQPQLVAPVDLDVITSYYVRLGWTREQFDAWLSSTRSPLKGRAHPKIVTLADANRVRWALKGMLQNRGLWNERVA
jgi:hypothetical protein